MATEVNSIEIPREFVELCEHWHGGKRSMFYAVASTGGLTLGANKLAGCETREQWYCSLWRDITNEVCRTCRQSLLQPDADDYVPLSKFKRFCDQTTERLEVEYGLQGWER